MEEQLVQFVLVGPLQVRQVGSHIRQRFKSGSVLPVEQVEVQVVGVKERVWKRFDEQNKHCEEDDCWFV